MDVTGIQSIEAPQAVVREALRFLKK